MCLCFSFTLAPTGGLGKSWDGGCLFPDSHSTTFCSRARNQPLQAWGPPNLCSVSWCVWEAPSPRNRASVIWHVCYPTTPSKPKPFEQWSYKHLGFQPPQGTWEELVPCVRDPSFMELHCAAPSQGWNSCYPMGTGDNLWQQRGMQHHRTWPEAACLRSICLPEAPLRELPLAGVRAGSPSSTPCSGSLALGGPAVSLPFWYYFRGTFLGSQSLRTPASVPYLREKGRVLPSR